MVIFRFESIVTGLHERSRRGIMDGLRIFIGVDNRSAVDVGGLRRGTKSIRVKPQFRETSPEAVIGEGADELTLRAEEVGCEPSSIRTMLSSSGGAASGRELARLYSSQ